MTGMLSKPRSFVWLLIASLLPSLGVAIYFIWSPSDSPWVLHLYSLLKTLQFLLPVIFWSYYRSAWLAVKKSYQNLRFMGWGVLSGVFALLFVAGSYSWFLKDLSFIGEVQYQINDNIQRLKVSNLNQFLILAFFISVIHSFLEEYYWRSFVNPLVKETFSPMKNTSIYLIGSLAFTLHHLVLLYKYLGSAATGSWIFFFGVFVFVAGVFWSYLYDKSQSIYSAWVSHIGADLGLMVMALHFVSFGG